MTEMLQESFRKLDNAQEAMKTQVSELFPEGFSEHNNAQKTKAEKFKNETLRLLIRAIEKATNEEIEEMSKNKQADSELGQAFDRLRKEIEGF